MTLCPCAEPLPLTGGLVAWLVPREHSPACVELREAADRVAELVDREDT